MKTGLNTQDSQTVEVTELYEVELYTGDVYYYTAYSEDIIWAGTTYTAIPVKRSPLSAFMNLQADKTTITLENISQEFAKELANNLLDGAKVTIKRIAFKESGAGAENTLFIGFADVSYNRSILTLDCTSILNTLNKQVPKNLYQEPCNNRLFDPACGLDRASYSWASVATSTAGDLYHITDSSISFAWDGYWDLGEVRITSGDNNKVRKMIRVVDWPWIYATTPYRTEIVAGTSYVIYPGCNKTPERCADFSNDDNFNGYLYIPRPEEALF